MAEGGGTVGRTVRRSRRVEGHGPLPSSTAKDPGTGISHSPGSWRHSLHRSSAPARNSNSGANYAAVFSRPAGLPGVCQCSQSPSWSSTTSCSRCREMPMPAWLRSLRHCGRRCGARAGMKDLDKLGINLETSSPVISLAFPPVDSVVTVIRTPMEALHQLDGTADDFI